MTDRRAHGWAGAAALLLVAAAPAPPAAEPKAAGDAPRFVTLLDRTLSGPLANAADVRWTGEEEVALTLVREGVVTLSTASADAEPETLVPAATWMGPAELGVSERFLAAGIELGPIGWMERSEGKPRPEGAPLDLVQDLDVHDDRLALLGARRGADGRWSPDGALTFVGSLSKDLADLRPITFSVDGPHSLNMARCVLLDTGAIRFLDDGRLVVVPGVEAGIYLYAPDGKLLRTWSSETLGFQDDCSFDEDTLTALQRDPHVRYRWFHSTVVLNGVFDLGGDPALVLRQPEEGGTSWQIVVLEDEGVRRIPFPVTTASTKSHLSIDRRGDRLAVLIREYGHGLGVGEAERRLLVLRIEP